MTTALPDATASPGDRPSQFDRLIRWRDSVSASLHRWFAMFDAALAGRAAWIGAIAFVLTLQVILTIDHRPWLDEWQALQLAVQSPHIGDLMFNLRYEGHPPLWYLILRELAAMFSDPIRALPAAALSIAVPVQLTILLMAPFSRAERLMLSLSEFVLFEYLTISRSLTLGIAVMIAIAALWKRPRLVWLLIAILPLCDFLFGVVSVLLVALRWRERRIFWPFAVLWVMSGLFAAWSIRPMPDISSALLPKGLLHDLPLWMSNFGTLGLPLQWNMLVPQWNKPPPLGIGGIALGGFMTVAWIETRKYRHIALAFWTFVLVTLVFSLTVYQLSIRHLTIAAAFLIILVWLMADTGESRSIWWRAWLLTISVCGLFTAAINLVEPFDTAPEAAATINRLGLRDKTWVPFPHSAGQAVAALSGMKFERLSQHCWEDFVRWNSPDEHKIETAAQLKILLLRKVAEDGRFYLISRYDVGAHLPLLKLIAAVPAGYDGEHYFMYAVGGQSPAIGVPPQPCAGPHAALRRGGPA